MNEDINGTNGTEIKSTLTIFLNIT